ncbi:hypothetical protein B296_00029184 [Ensete ventricosum]|uniref:Uncharacterized protein n=1 Tax=Ensete ventricosum TaxID=4639 RepID=A0A426ZQP4_ENSVE|nr:hypothetical protein B296_00029184 [Ensete ventricosum]
MISDEGGRGRRESCPPLLLKLQRNYFGCCCCHVLLPAVGERERAGSGKACRGGIYGGWHYSRSLICWGCAEGWYLERGSLTEMDAWWKMTNPRCRFNRSDLSVACTHKRSIQKSPQGKDEEAIWLRN